MQEKISLCHSKSIRKCDWMQFATNSLIILSETGELKCWKLILQRTPSSYRDGRRMRRCYTTRCDALTSWFLPKNDNKNGRPTEALQTAILRSDWLRSKNSSNRSGSHFWLDYLWQVRGHVTTGTKTCNRFVGLRRTDPVVSNERQFKKK